MWCGTEGRHAPWIVRVIGRWRDAGTVATATVPPGDPALRPCARPVRPRTLAACRRSRPATPDAEGLHWPPPKKPPRRSSASLSGSSTTCASRRTAGSPCRWAARRRSWSPRTGRPTRRATRARSCGCGRRSAATSRRRPELFKWAATEGQSKWFGSVTVVEGEEGKNAFVHVRPRAPRRLHRPGGDHLRGQRDHVHRATSSTTSCTTASAASGTPTRTDGDPGPGPRRGGRRRQGLRACRGGAAPRPVGPARGARRGRAGLSGACRSPSPPPAARDSCGHAGRLLGGRGATRRDHRRGVGRRHVRGAGRRAAWAAARTERLPQSLRQRRRPPRRSRPTRRRRRARSPRPRLRRTRSRNSSRSSMRSWDSARRRRRCGASSPSSG